MKEPEPIPQDLSQKWGGSGEETRGKFGVFSQNDRSISLEVESCLRSILEVEPCLPELRHRITLKKDFKKFNKSLNGVSPTYVDGMRESEGQLDPLDMDRWVAMAAPGVIIAQSGAGPP